MHWPSSASPASAVVVAAKPDSAMRSQPAPPRGAGFFTTHLLPAKSRLAAPADQPSLTTWPYWALVPPCMLNGCPEMWIKTRSLERSPPSHQQLKLCINRLLFLLSTTHPPNPTHLSTVRKTIGKMQKSRTIMKLRHSCFATGRVRSYCRTPRFERLDDGLDFLVCKDNSGLCSL